MVYLRGLSKVEFPTSPRRRTTADASYQTLIFADLLLQLFNPIRKKWWVWTLSKHQVWLMLLTCSSGGAERMNRINLIFLFFFNHIQECLWSFVPESCVLLANRSIEQIFAQSANRILSIKQDFRTNQHSWALCNTYNSAWPANLLSKPYSLSLLDLVYICMCEGSKLLFSLAPSFFLDKKNWGSLFCLEPFFNVRASFFFLRGLLHVA